MHFIHNATKGSSTHLHGRDCLWPLFSRLSWKIGAFMHMNDITLHSYRLNLKEPTSSLFQHGKDQQWKPICVIKHCRNQESEQLAFEQNRPEWSVPIGFLVVRCRTGCCHHSPPSGDFWTRPFWNMLDGCHTNTVNGRTPVEIHWNLSKNWSLYRYQMVHWHDFLLASTVSGLWYLRLISLDIGMVVDWIFVDICRRLRFLLWSKHLQSKSFSDFLPLYLSWTEAAPTALSKPKVLVGHTLRFLLLKIPWLGLIPASVPQCISCSGLLTCSNGHTIFLENNNKQFALFF